MKKIRNDIILITSLLVIALAALLILLITRKDGARVLVEQNGSLYGEFSLENDKDIKLHGAVLVIKDWHAYVKDATCPDKLCEMQSKINKTGETIVCLPNRIVITVDTE